MFIKTKLLKIFVTYVVKLGIGIYKWMKVMLEEEDNVFWWGSGVLEQCT